MILSSQLCLSGDVEMDGTNEYCHQLGHCYLCGGEASDNNVPSCETAREMAL